MEANECRRRGLTRRDQEERAKRRLRERIEEGLNSGQGRVMTREVTAELRHKALGNLP